MNNNSLKVGTAVIGLLLVIVTITSLISDCPESRVKFESPASDVKLPCGAKNVSIPCNYTIVDGNYTKMGNPCWVINGSSTPYCAFSDPLDGFRIRISASGVSLVVTDSSLPGINNTRVSCRLELVGSDSMTSTCTCNSPEHLLVTKVCELPRIEHMPVYSLKMSGHGSLQRINTTLNLTDLEDDSIAPTYTITYSNSLGNVCDSSIIDSASNCTGRICNHVFDVSSSGSSNLCSDTQNVSVTVSTTNSDTSVNHWELDPVIIDTVNRLVNLSVDIEQSTIKCIFLDHEISKTNRLCSIKHGPAASDCGTEFMSEESENYEAKSIAVGGLDFSYIGTDTELCISLRAGIGNKKWTVEGIYDIRRHDTSETEPIATSDEEEKDSGRIELSPIVLLAVVMMIITIIIVIFVIVLLILFCKNSNK